MVKHLVLRKSLFSTQPNCIFGIKRDDPDPSLPLISVKNIICFVFDENFSVLNEIPKKEIIILSALAVRDPKKEITVNIWSRSKIEIKCRRIEK